MKNLIINKEINVNDINIKAGEIAEMQPDGSYKTKSGITIPSYIDIDNKKNFTEVVVRFSIGEFVVVNTEVFTVPNYVGIVADIVLDKNSPNNVQYFIEPYEKNKNVKRIKIPFTKLSKAELYWFINSKGKVNSRFKGLDPIADNWLKVSNNCFKTREEARLHYAKTMPI